MADFSHPISLGDKLTKEIESLGRVLLQFYRAVNLLYRKSAEGKLPEWVARWLDLGKPAELIARQRAAGFKNDVPRVIRPDLLITEDGLRDRWIPVPGGIGLTRVVEPDLFQIGTSNAKSEVLGGADGMVRGFASIFGGAHVHVVVSDEAATYRPEMQWLAEQLGARFTVRDASYTGFAEGDAAYRFLSCSTS